MPSGKVSILIPAHNEEKTIGTALDALQNIKSKEYKEIEVLVGLDACTDSTKEIVGKYPFAKIYKSNKRMGKPAMLKKLYDKAEGEIIIVHDADWSLVSNNNFKNIFAYFKDSKVGGLNNCRIPSSYYIPLLSLGEAQTYVLMREFNIKKNTEKDKGKIIEKKDSSFPLMVDMFRKSALPQRQLTLCDDGERSIQLRKNGYKVAVAGNDVPFFAVNYFYKPKLREIIRHGERRTVARRQVKKLYGGFRAGLFDFYLPAFLYCIKKTAFSKAFLGVLLYWITNYISVIKAKTSKISTKEGWEIRCRT